MLSNWKSKNLPEMAKVYPHSKFVKIVPFVCGVDHWIKVRYHSKIYFLQLGYLKTERNGYHTSKKNLTLTHDITFQYVYYEYVSMYNWQQCESFPSSVKNPLANITCKYKKWKLPLPFLNDYGNGIYDFPQLN